MTATRLHARVCASCRRGDTWPRGLFSHYALVTTELLRLRKLAATVQQSRQIVRLVALRGGME